MRVLVVRAGRQAELSSRRAADVWGEWHSSDVTGECVEMQCDSRDFAVRLSGTHLGDGDVYAVLVHGSEGVTVRTREQCPATLTFALEACMPEVRLFLCQKDEHALLEPWLRRALAVATTPRHVCVYDDASTHPDVLETLRRASERGVRVVRREAHERDFFSRKHLLFGAHVLECTNDVHTLFVPTDADDFLVTCAYARRPRACAVTPSCTLQCKLTMDTDVAQLAIALGRAACTAARHGYFQYQRFRNLSFARDVYYRPDEPPKVIVYGGGTRCIRNQADAHCIGYHSLSVPRDMYLGEVKYVCGVEFHNVPHALRVEKSIMMRQAPGVSHHRYRKYDRIARCTQEEYETLQLEFAKTRTCAHSESCSRLVAL